jgi:hypothetical protein
MADGGTSYIRHPTSLTASFPLHNHLRISPSRVEVVPLFSVQHFDSGRFEFRHVFQRKLEEWSRLSN